MGLLSAIGFSMNISFWFEVYVLVYHFFQNPLMIVYVCLFRTLCLQGYLVPELWDMRVRVTQQETGPTNIQNIYVHAFFLNVNITHLKKPCVLHFRIWKCFRSLKDLLFAIVLSMYIPGSQRHFVLIRVVCFCCLLIYWFLDDFNTHSYRIRYHDSYLGRSIKETMLSWNGRSCCSEYAVFQCHGRGISAVEPAAYLETAA